MPTIPSPRNGSIGSRARQPGGWEQRAAKGQIRTITNAEESLIARQGAEEVFDRVRYATVGSEKSLFPC